MEIIIVWLLLAVGVGALASSRGRSGVGFFLLSALLSPLLGLIIVLVMQNPKEEEAKERIRREEHERQLESIRAIASSTANGGRPGTLGPTTTSVADELIKLGELKNKGLLTEAEFQSQKTALLQPSQVAQSVSPQPTKPQPATPDAVTMEKLGVTFDGERYCFQQFRYDKLEDAIKYAELQAKRRDA